MQKKRTKTYANNVSTPAKGDGSGIGTPQKEEIMAKRRRIIRFKGMSTRQLESHLRESKGKKLPARARKKK